MKEKLKIALNEISEKHITEAAKGASKRAIFLRIAAAAAVVAVVVGLFRMPRPIFAKAVVTAPASRAQLRPNRDDYKEYQDFKAELDAWEATVTARNEAVAAAQTAVSDFFTDANAHFLSGSENAIWSPTNAWIGLAMAAELTGGESREQILDALGADSMDTLRSQVSAVWESVYKDNGSEICTLANSLWLQKGLGYEQQTMDNIAHHHYASVYQTNLQTAGGAIGAWLNNNTGGLLKNATDINLPQDAVLALYSTLYFQGKWQDQFRSYRNTTGAFHAPDGDTTVTYMNRSLAQMNYYWGECYGAVSLGLKNGSRMWFILPDEGLTPADVLADGQYMDMILSPATSDYKYMKVNLSVPKFDISAKAELAGGLRELGITDVFDPAKSDFSALTSDSPVFLTAANQALRVQIDEEGVKAAVYIEIPGAGSAMPPEEIIDFVLDRPFLFVITGSSMPLFAGVVNEP